MCPSRAESGFGAELVQACQAYPWYRYRVRFKSRTYWLMATASGEHCAVDIYAIFKGEGIGLEVNKELSYTAGILGLSA
jgi:hypothetical protein